MNIFSINNDSIFANPERQKSVGENAVLGQEHLYAVDIALQNTEFAASRHPEIIQASRSAEYLKVVIPQSSSLELARGSAGKLGVVAEVNAAQAAVNQAVTKPEDNPLFYANGPEVVAAAEQLVEEALNVGVREDA
ncbi:MAG: hypothetical protein ABI220_04065 [Candidatus Saccharimonadales bacterium]